MWAGIEQHELLVKILTWMYVEVRLSKTFLIKLEDLNIKCSVVIRIIEVNILLRLIVLSGSKCYMVNIVYNMYRVLYGYCP